VSITVTDKSPTLARDIADAVRDVSREHITNVMNVEAVNTAEFANLPQEPANPNVIINTLIGGLVGAFLVIAIILIRFFLDDSIKTSEDVERYMELSTLAMIPVYNENKKKSKSKKAHDKYVAEAFRQMMAEIEDENEDENETGKIAAAEDDMDKEIIVIV
jgi:hypothetical protein